MTATHDAEASNVNANMDNNVRFKDSSLEDYDKEGNSTKGSVKSKKSRARSVSWRAGNKGNGRNKMGKKDTSQGAESEFEENMNRIDMQLREQTIIAHHAGG